jgi:potassium voltage-gated channel Eag-related subfamily H protein 8
MERIINNRLNWFLETNDVIAKELAGFRLLNRSTTEQVANHSQAFKDALDKKHVLTAVFIDFKSSYDSLWKENLLLKLAKLGTKSNLLKWI